MGCQQLEGTRLVFFHRKFRVRVLRVGDLSCELKTVDPWQAIGFFGENKI